MICLIKDVFNVACVKFLVWYKTQLRTFSYDVWGLIKEYIDNTHNIETIKHAIILTDSWYNVLDESLEYDIADKMSILFSSLFKHKCRHCFMCHI